MNFERLNRVFQDAEKNGVQLSITPEVICEDIDSITPDQWLTYRKLGIGGSDAGKIMGTNSYDSDLEKLAKDKMGLLPKEAVDYKTQARFDLGHATEPATAKTFSAITGFETFFDNRMYRHQCYPYMIANCDAFCYDDEGMKCGVELKYIHPENLKFWRSGIYGDLSTNFRVHNESYVTQAMHYMAVTNLDRWYLVIWGGNKAEDMKIIRIDRNLEMEKTIIDREGWFWSFVSNGEYPEQDTHTDEAFKQLIKESCDEMQTDEYQSLKLSENGYDLREISEKLLEHQEKLKTLNKKAKDIKDEDNELKKKMIEVMGLHGTTCAIIEDYSTETYIDVTYKRNKDKEKVDLFKLSSTYPELYKKLKDEGIIEVAEGAQTFRISEKPKFKR